MIQSRTCKQIVFFLLSAMLMGAFILPRASAEEAGALSLQEGEPGYYAYQVMSELSVTIGPRVAGSDEEARAAEYLLRQFQEIGLAAEKQAFSYQSADGKSVDSANIIATKPGNSSRVVYVGAHYDSVDAGNGADDNASGVGVLLETARMLAETETPYTIKFIAFGAEEDGLNGSYYYVSQLAEEEIESAVGMINLDSLAAGDDMLIYGNHGSDGFIRELGLDIADRLNLDVSTQPGLHPLYPAGTTADASDHVPFKYAGIPYGYLEATNWELGDGDGYTQTEKDGYVWHTEKDTLAYIAENYPGRIEEHLSAFTQLLTHLLLEIEPTAAKAFTDLESVEWADEAITALASMDIVIGDEENRFNPLEPVTRAEMTTMLVRALGIYDQAGIVMFDDVRFDDWHYPFIAAYVSQGLAEGVGDGKFAPDRPITRQEMAVFGSNVLKALFGLEAEHTEASLGVYKDGSEIADYARESVALLTEEGIMQGVTGNKFNPNGTVNRAQAAVMIYNLLSPK